MGDFGIKVSQPGKDVQDSGDQDMLFSSAWPTPKIIFQGRFPVTKLYGSLYDTYQLIEHNLGYVPMFLDYTISDETYILRESRLSADKNFIYYFHDPLNTNDIGVLVFDTDITKNFEAPNINLGSSSSTGVDKDFGIKYSKEGKDYTSDDLRDFLIHSSTRTPLIHAVSHGPPNGSGVAPGVKNFNYTHNLPYNPMFLGYLKDGGVSRYYLVNNTSFLTFTTADKDTLTVTGLQGDDALASIVVFKDPFQIDEEIII